MTPKLTVSLFLSMLITIFHSVPVFAQKTDSSWPEKILKGYVKSISGEILEYHSPHPDVKTSLLVRSLDSNNSIEWETEPVPENTPGNTVSFAWMFGIDVNPETHSFHLTINGTPYLTFYTPPATEKKPWTIRGKNNVELSFRPTMIDKHNDLMGYAILTMPRSLIIPGKPQRIKVSGETAQSRTWYMTFQAIIEEKTEIVQYDALIEKNGTLFHPVRFQFLLLGAPVQGDISIEPGVQKTFNLEKKEKKGTGKKIAINPEIEKKSEFENKGTGKKIEIEKKFRLEPGLNIIQVIIPEVNKETVFNAGIRVGNHEPRHMDFVLKPVRRWTLYLVQHAHTDIGYTRPQTEILPEHLRFIDYALDFCDQTDDYPDDAKFRWTCETAWPVREYLRSRPSSQIERLKKRIHEGRIEVTGLFLNMSEMLDNHMLAKQLQPIKEFKKHGIQVHTAMQNDINGVCWGLVDMLDSAGIRYLSMGENTHRALKPFDKPTLFQWESPSGNRLLTFRGEHYMLGNNLYLIHKNLENFETALLNYLVELKTQGYSYDRFAIHFSGYVTDNSPPSTTACDMVREWNNKYAWPKLRIAVAREFLQYMEQHHLKDFPVYKAAWPDWWMDGFGTAARETGFARKTHAEIAANEGLLAMAALGGTVIPPRTMDNIRRIHDNLVFYDEHTFTAAESISDPTCENTILQWNQKAAYTWDGVKKNALLKEEAMGLLQPSIPRLDVPSLVVFNTLNWKRSGLIEIYIDHEIISPGKPFRIVDEKGGEIPAQPLSSRSDGTYWAVWVKDIPPVGYKIYRIETRNPKAAENLSEPFYKPSRMDRFPPTKTFNNVLENNFYKLIIDMEKGALRSFFDKESNKEWVDPSWSGWQPGQFIYERLGNDRHQLELFKLEKFTRTPWTHIKAGSITDGPIWKSLAFTGFSPECADSSGINCEIRLYKTEKRVEIKYSMRKLPVTEPESVYIPFTFSIPEGHIVFDTAGGTVIPGKNQLERSASDWNAVQDFAALRSSAGQLVLVSPMTPLHHFGEINTGKFQPIANPGKPHIFSWVLNNYWTTNFLASQEGELNWNYIITTSADSSDLVASKFGYGSRVPLPARVIPAGKPGPQPLPLSKSFLEMDFGSVVLVSAEPADDGKGIILHLKEVDGKKVQVDFSGFMEKNKTAELSEVNVLGEEVQGFSPVVTFKPYEVRFIRINY